MADERADDREAVGLDVLLDGVRDVPEPPARVALVDRGEQRPARRLEQALRYGADVADRNGDRGVRDPAVEDDADVDRQDVAAAEPVATRNAVHDHRVRRGADRPREAAVALEGGLGAVRADELLRDDVEVARGRSRPGLRAQRRQAAREDLPGGRHLLDLLGRLPDDHATISVPPPAMRTPPARPELALAAAFADALMRGAGAAERIRAGRDQPRAVAAEHDHLDARAAARGQAQQDMTAPVAAEHEPPVAIDEHLKLRDPAVPAQPEAEVARRGAAAARWQPRGSGRP